MSTVTSSRRDSRGGKACAGRAASDRARVRGGPRLGLLLVSLAAWAPRARAAPAKPSIVLVLTDDQDASLTGYMPNLQALARQGATFARAYYNDPLCAPLPRHHPDRPLRPQHRRHRERPPAVLRRRPAGPDGRGPAARGRLPHRLRRQVPQRVSRPGPRHLRPARLGLLGGAPRRDHERDLALEHRVRLRPERQRHGRAPRRRAVRLRDRRLPRQGGRLRPQGRRGRGAVLPRAGHPRAALPGHARAARRGPVPRPRGAPGAVVRRGRRQRQAGLHPRPAAVRPRQGRREVPAAGPLAAGGRRRAEGDHRRAGGRRAAGEHLRRVHLRQRFRAGPAPPRRPEEHALRGDGPDAALRARPRRRGRAWSCRRWWATSTWRRPSPRGRARPCPAGLDGRSFAPLLRPGAPGPGAWRQAYPLNQLSRVGIPSWRGCGRGGTPTSSTRPARRSCTTTPPTRTSSGTSPRRPTRPCWRSWRGGRPLSPPARTAAAARSRMHLYNRSGGGRARRVLGPRTADGRSALRYLPAGQVRGWIV